MVHTHPNSSIVVYVEVFDSCGFRQSVLHASWKIYDGTCSKTYILTCQNLIAPKIGNGPRIAPVAGSKI